MALVSHCDPVKGGSAFNTAYVSDPVLDIGMSVMMTMTLAMRLCEIGTRVSETRRRVPIFLCASLPGSQTDRFFMSSYTTWCILGWAGPQAYSVCDELGHL